MAKSKQTREPKKKKNENEGRLVVTSNRKAFHEFEIIEKHEAGLALVGPEVKSIYLGKANLQDSFCRVNGGEIFVVNLYVAPYEWGGIHNTESRRTRKLLMHKKEIARIDAKTKEKGYTIVPLVLYFRNGKVKVEIGLAKGKKLYDRREQIAERETRREQERELRGKD